MIHRFAVLSLLLTSACIHDGPSPADPEGTAGGDVDTGGTQAEGGRGGAVGLGGGGAGGEGVGGEGVGGQGDGGYGPARPLAFPDGDAYVYVGDQFQNVAVPTDSGGGLNDPPIVYTSSDPGLATVDDDGTVDALGSGFVTINATMSGDDNVQTSASYDILISFEMAGFIGTNDTEIVFDDGATGMTWYRTTDPDCDIQSILTCADGQTDSIVAAQPYVDTALTLNRDAFYTYEVAVDDHRQRPMSATVSAGMADGMVVAFKERLFAVAGSKTNLSYSVRSSYDGSNWVFENEFAEFWDRFESGVVVHDDKLWIINGKGPVFFNEPDVWYSDDGVTWTDASLATPFERSGHAAFSFNGKLWVVGGFDSTDGNVHDDIWSSSDGTTWTEEASTAAFPAGAGHRVTELNGTLYLVTEDAQEVYSSTDAINWTQETGATTIPSRDGYALGAFENKLYLSGGNNGYFAFDPGTFYDDLWSSEDGKTWTQVATSGLAKRGFHSIVTLDHRMWLVGGSDHAGPRSDVRSTLDGQNWVSEAGPEALGERKTSPLVEFDGRLWMLGGDDGTPGTLNSVWSSPDGIRWEREPNLPGVGRFAHFIEHDGKLFTVGGKKGESLRTDDVWSSDDGQTWNQLIAEDNAPFSERADHFLVSAGGHIHMFGGTNDQAQIQTDVWSSTDGISWSVTTSDNPALIGREGVGYAVKDDVIYAIGGAVGSTHMSDVWSSANGVNWTLVTADGGFAGRRGHRVIAFGGTLFVIGGSTGTNFFSETNSVWSSDDDGLTWQEVAAAPAFSPRAYVSAAGFNNMLVMYGGVTLLPTGQFADLWTSADGGATWRKPYRSVFRL